LLNRARQRFRNIYIGSVSFLSFGARSLGYENLRRESPRYECARHNASTRDTHLAGLFLCDDCTALFQRDLFSGARSESELGPIDGFCVYCGQERQVHERFWYLCGICERVVRSYPSEKAATDFLSGWWAQVRQRTSALADVDLRRTDPVRLMSYQAHRRWREQPHESAPDFTGFKGRDQAILAIEMKTGRNPINRMSAFQLDISDCDDILAFVGQLRLPSYLFHVQVVEEYRPPTSKRVAIDAWWLSVFDMEQAFQYVRRRQREQRPAGFFRRTAFRRLEEFPTHITSAEFQELGARIKERLPVLYDLSRTR